MKRRQRLLKEYELASKANLMSKPYCFQTMGQHQSRIKDKWQWFGRALEVFQRQMWLHGNTGEPIVSTKNTVNEDSPYQKILSLMETIASISGAKKRAIVRGIMIGGNRRE